MRDLDRIATAARRETARKKRKLVERDVVSRVIEADTRARSLNIGVPRTGGHRAMTIVVYDRPRPVRLG